MWRNLNDRRRSIMEFAQNKSLQDIELKPEYNTEDDDIINDLRHAGYFKLTKDEK